MNKYLYIILIAITIFIVIIFIVKINSLFVVTERSTDIDLRIIKDSDIIKFKNHLNKKRIFVTYYSEISVENSSITEKAFLNRENSFYIFYKAIGKKQISANESFALIKVNFIIYNWQMKFLYFILVFLTIFGIVIKTLNKP